MKKLILATTLLALAGMNVQNANAGDCEWATVGKVLTGVAATAVIVNALDCPPARISVGYSTCAPAYTYCPPPAPVVCAPPVVYAPARVVYATPVVVCAPPVYAAPHPVVNVHHGYYRGHGHGRGHRGRW